MDKKPPPPAPLDWSAVPAGLDSDAAAVWTQLAAGPSQFTEADRGTLGEYCEARAEYDRLGRQLAAEGLYLPGSTRANPAEAARSRAAARMLCASRRLRLTPRGRFEARPTTKKETGK